MAPFRPLRLTVAIPRREPPMCSSYDEHAMHALKLPYHFCCASAAEYEEGLQIASPPPGTGDEGRAFSARRERQGRSAHAALYQRDVCRIHWPQLHPDKHLRGAHLWLLDILDLHVNPCYYNLAFSLRISDMVTAWQCPVSNACHACWKARRGLPPSHRSLGGPILPALQLCTGLRSRNIGLYRIEHAAIGTSWMKESLVHLLSDCGHAHSASG